MIPALGDHMLLGQSTWLLLPQYWLAERAARGDRATFWHGLLVAPGMFKPHVAALAWVWLAVRWRGQWRAYAGWLAGVLLLSVPAFVLQPDWPLAWLAVAFGGRAEDSTIGRASLYLVADRLALPMLIDDQHEVLVVSVTLASNWIESGRSASLAGVAKSWIRLAVDSSA